MNHPSTREFWIEQFADVPEGDVAALNQAISKRPEVQQWLRPRLEQAVYEVMTADDLTVQAATQARLEQELRKDFQGLAEVIRSLTASMGELRIDWEASAPHRSRVVVWFNVAVPVDIFLILEVLDSDAIEAALQRVLEMLPSTAPFPGHPHELGALFIFEGRKLPFQLIDSQREGHRMTRLKFLPREIAGRPTVDLRDATAAVTEYFRMTRTA